MSEFLGWFMVAAGLGIYWAFVAPRLERAPNWFKVPFVIVGGAMIAGLIALVILGIWAKYS